MAKTLVQIENSVTLSESNSYGSIIEKDDYLYVLGAASGIIQIFHINAGGSLTRIANDVGLTIARTELSALEKNGYIYVIGGGSNNSIDVFQINANGSLTKITNSVTLTENRFLPAVIEKNDYLYVIGQHKATIDILKINAGGSLTRVANNVGIQNISPGDGFSFEKDGYIYTIGGLSGIIAIYQINADGNLTLIKTSSCSPYPAKSFTSIVKNNYLYVTGAGTKIDIYSLTLLPIISGVNAYLGIFSDSFTPYAYTVSKDPEDDEELDAATVTERLDNVLLRQFQLPLDEQSELSFEGIAWTKILNGQRTLKIEAFKPNGDSAIRTLTFTKNENVLVFRMSNPAPELIMPTKIVLGFPGQFPAGQRTIEACNNALDAEPAWETVPAQSTIYEFTNTTTTAAQWAVNIRVTLERGEDTGDVFIDDAELSYE
jgi:6-phosphogluconolactonase (cycloisomerase 2 family)